MAAAPSDTASHATLPHDPRVDIEKFRRDGYNVISGAYSAAEVQTFRDAISEAQGPSRDLLSRDVLRGFITDGKIAAVARTILGSDDLVYAGDSSFTRGNQQHGFHKDNADRDDPKAPDWQSDYTILRFGLYLQDHARHTGGLNLRVGSHNFVNLTQGENRYIRAEIGDLLVWSLRTTHSGNGRLFRTTSGRFLRKSQWHMPEPTNKPKFPSAWQEAVSDIERMALFAAIGLNDAHHDRYTEYLKSRTYIANMWRNSHYSPEAIAEAAAVGITVRDVPTEIADDPTVGQNEKWQALAY